MSRIIGFRVTDEEEGVVLREMLAAGEDVIGIHVKRVYFEAIGGLETRSSSSLMEDIFLNVKYLREKENARPEENLMLQLLCGMYVMLRNSVSDNVKKEADEYIDVAEIEKFLRG